MKRLALLFLTGTIALAVSACEFTVVVDPFPNAIEVEANTNRSAERASPTLGAGEAVVYEVLLSDPVRQNLAMYFELDTNDVDLVLYSPSGAVLASSSRDDVFEAGTLGLSGQEGGVSSAQLVQSACRGTCIIRDSNAAVFYLRLINRATSSRSFNMYLYSTNYDDANEPSNDTTGGAVSLSLGSDDGALEDIGDRDWWRMNDSGQLSFDDSTLRPGILAMRALMFASDGTTQVAGPFAPGESFSVFADEYVRIYELDNDAAGPSASSVYFLTLN